MSKKQGVHNNTSIAPKAYGNTVIQGCNIGNVFMYSGTSDLIKTMGKFGDYEGIQAVINDCIFAAKQVHPLRPHYTVKYNSELERLVSTPETEEAFKQYPKVIKGAFVVDYEKYPYMNKTETPWEYAYRTQTSVELQNTAYQEYLGDMVDPFPSMEYSNGMITVIGPASFPPEIDATIVSGDISIPICIRRKPCMEYGKLVLGTVTNKGGLEITLTTYQDKDQTDIRITKIPERDLSIQLKREQLINNIRETKHVSIMVGESPLLDATFNDEDFSDDIFVFAPRIVEYLKNMQIIEKNTGCKFDLSADLIKSEDFRTAFILASSLEGKWHRLKEAYDDNVRCDYNHIPLDIEDYAESLSDKVFVGRDLHILLHGQEFYAEQYSVIYQNARINNIKSIIKNCKKKRKNIKITFRPLKGKDYFYKYIKFEKIRAKIIESNE